LVRRTKIAINNAMLVMTNVRNLLLVPVCAMPLICLGNAPAKAVLVVNALQSGSDVVFTYSGSFDLTGLAQNSLTYSGYGGLDPSTGEFFSGPGNYVNYTGAGSLSSFGSGSFRTSSNSSGTIFSLSPDNAGLLIGLPSGYTSNSVFSGSTTFASTTFSGLNVTQGVYVTTLPNDTITINIGAVPAPLPLLGLGAAAAFSRKLKQRIALRRKREELGEAA